MTIARDTPIRRPEDDVLGRSSLAQSFAQHVLTLDATEGVVVGILGPWGSGKTSFINLARSSFEKAGAAILDFNPWMFSGAEQLVESFFIELSAQLKVRPDFVEIGKNLEDYGETFSLMAWVPLVGPWIERGRGASKIFGRLLQRRKEGVGGRRAKLEKALRKLEKPILVVIDDIDRLSSSEIQDVFKLVRLTASFPQIIYVVAFDRTRVEGALAEQALPGRAYLEKILQVVIDLPAVPDQVLDRQITSAINEALADIDVVGPFDQTWPDLYMEIIRPLIRNMRDVRRYAASISGTVGSFEGEVALADVLALEAVRVFIPDVFKHLHGAVEGLTTTTDDAADAPLRAKVELLLRDAGVHTGVVRAMIRRLFPAGERHIGGSHYGVDWIGRWLRERRVAHEDILRLYLERTVGEDLRAYTDAEKAFSKMANREVLDGFLRSLEPERREDVISALSNFEDQFQPEHVVPGTVGLLNLLPDIPDRRRGLFELPSRIVVSAVTFRLLRSLGNPSAVEAAVREILPQLTTLSAKFEVVTDIGYREGAGHRLVSENAAAEFEKAWREEVRSASVNDLIKEADLERVLIFAIRETSPSEGLIEIDDSPQMTLAVLRSAQNETLSGSMNSRAVRRSARLDWDVLTELYGGEATLKERIEALEATHPSGADEILTLANRYLDGWRPGRGDEE